MSDTEKKDFYYSISHELHLMELEQLFFHDDDFKYHKSRFKGKVYTECVDHGKEPLTKKRFGQDMIFLGTGTLKDIT